MQDNIIVHKFFSFGKKQVTEPVNITDGNFPYGVLQILNCQFSAALKCCFKGFLFISESKFFQRRFIQDPLEFPSPSHKQIFQFTQPRKVFIINFTICDQQ